MTTVREFSCVDLKSGGARTVAALERPGDRAVLAITFFRDGKVVTRMLFFSGRDVDVVEAAIFHARDPELSDERDAGLIPVGSGCFIRVWASADRGSGAVVFQRQHGNRDLGRPTRIKRAELDALEQAVEYVKARSRARNQKRNETK